MSRSLATCFVFLVLVAMASAQAGRIYTVPDQASQGSIEGHVETALTHAIAIDHERTHVYLAELSDGGRAFHFARLPVGKYDVVLVTKDGAVYEDLALGDAPDSLPSASMKNLETRIAVADSFFNRHNVHRIGMEGDHALAFVERIRDKLTLRQSGEKLDANVRRLEIIELVQAGDDWQMSTSRHIYREAEPLKADPPFFKHIRFSGLGNIRVVDNVKDLGLLSLPKN